jgi:predicted metal-dependent phosphoesterase TrpH
MPDQPPTFDLQAHSTHSDGSLPAAEVVARAAAAGVELFAHTDHDSVGGVDEALAAAARHGIALSPAAELSAVHGGYEDLHVVGYELDHTDPELLAALEDFRGDRVRRVRAMADRMRELGFAVDDRQLENRPSLGRPHLADAVLSHPDNQERLRAEGIRDKNGLFPPYLVPGAAAYVPRSHPTVAEAIEVIHAAGGVAVWAHPFWDLAEPEEVLETLASFTDAGLDGVETFYVTHTLDQTRLLHRVAVDDDLLATGSSDFHGPGHERFGGFLRFDLCGLRPRLGPIGTRAGYTPR